MKSENINLYFVIIAAWGFAGWFLLSKLYAKYRKFQVLHGDIPEDKKDQEHLSGLAETVILIIKEKLAEVKKQLILIPNRRK
jgi:hypothetical protein